MPRGKLQVERNDGLARLELSLQETGKLSRELALIAKCLLCRPDFPVAGNLPVDTIGSSLPADRMMAKAPQIVTKDFLVPRVIE